MTRNKRFVMEKTIQKQTKTKEIRKVEETRRFSLVSQFFEKVLTAKSLFSYLLTPGHISVWSFLPRPLSRGGILTGAEPSLDYFLIKVGLYINILLFFCIVLGPFCLSDIKPQLHPSDVSCLWQIPNLPIYTLICNFGQFIDLSPLFSICKNSKAFIAL